MRRDRVGPGGVDCRVRATLGLFRLPAFRVVWASTLAGAGAQWMERVISAWLALGLGGDAIAVGATLAVRLLPFVLFGLVAGTVADRVPRRALLMTVAAAAAL